MENNCNRGNERGEKPPYNLTTTPSFQNENQHHGVRNPQQVKEKFEKWKTMKTEGIDFNQNLINNPAFHNPNIANKMLEFVGIKEHGSNFSKDFYNPDFFPEEADWESIGRKQRAELEARQHPHTQTSKKSSIKMSKYDMMRQRFYSRD